LITSIDEPEDKFKIYPNPVVEVLKIRSSELIDKLIVIDFSGKIVFQENTSFINLDLDVDNLEKGIRLLILEIDNHLFIEKIVIE
jgi:hypothetical protein